ncbi:hypothetical protein DWB61_11970 [Ancylomarina euxinus]|uniref:Uncharacterized protein n=1 Tax=Ancylomarina euxinus TaxID=2283627 RepID=A0A425XZS7_9BACT|nr:hypothetical protein DWB61_11970 [Ancylomarina euxinus]
MHLFQDRQIVRIIVLRFIVWVLFFQDILLFKRSFFALSMLILGKKANIQALSLLILGEKAII